MRRLGIGLVFAFAAIAAVGAAKAANEEDADSAAAKKGGSAFYQKTATASCASGTCTATFAKASGGKVIETTLVSCTANASGFNAIPAYATLRDGSDVLAYIPLQPFSNGSNDTLATGALGATAFIDKGRIPSVVISGGATSASCTLSGRLTK